MVVLSDIAQTKVSDLCHRYSVARLSVFGSALRDELHADSDLDLLVEFQPGRTPGFGFFQLQEDLSSALGRRVDLNTPAFLSPYFRDRVLAEARQIYENAG